jgi:hypothetical protein
VTERTIRMLAKQMAGAFYEGSRSGRFREGEDLVDVFFVKQTGIGPVECSKKVPLREAFPNAKAYVEGYWPHWYDAARLALVNMLAAPDGRITPHMKDGIADALIEDREKQLKNPLDSKYLRQVRTN